MNKCIFMSYILGIDLGETSMGVAILNEKNGEPISLDSMGVRIFPDGREEKSKEPLNVARRVARGIRRNVDRRLQRKENLLNFLIENKLISQNQEERLNLKTLNPYQLRAKGLDEKLSLNELSRALIHINQRRGFLSNRKTDKNQTDSNMKLAMKEIVEKIKENNCRTLGEYLYLLYKNDDHSTLRVKVEEVKGKSVYSYFPSRQLYKDEVEAILNKQIEFYPELKNLKDEIINIIFYQRPLKEQISGKCVFEDNEFRYYKASPLFQEFRILCELRNLELADFKNGTCLSSEDRNKIKELLFKQKEVKFNAIRKAIGISNINFNLESEKRDKLEGDKVSYEFLKSENFGDLWKNFDENKKEEIVDILINTEKEEEVEKYLKLNFPSLNEEQIENIKEVRLPDGYANLSLKAIKKLLPHLRNGKRYDEACEIEYGSHSKKQGDVYQKLPYYGEILYKSCIPQSNSANEDEAKYGKITNVTVHIGLNQLRKIINEIIDEKGKPEYIAIELARDLKMNKKEKAELKSKQDKETKENEKINEILRQNGLKENYDNRMLYKIWENLANDPLKRVCPFCGESISPEYLLSGQAHIEHLLPFSRTFDDSIGNKVISCSACNSAKGNRTPFEFLGSNKEKYSEVLARVEFLPKNTRWRFSENAMEKFNDENKILARMLSDTQYLSKSATEYLSCLFLDDSKKHIRTSPGKLTSLLRHHWGLNTIVNEDENKKDRTDHRHHAIDAFVVACTTQSTLNKVSKASSQRFITKTDKLIENLEDPFENFNIQDIKRVVDNIIISYRSDTKNVEETLKKGKTVAKLHNDTYYGLIEDLQNGEGIFAVKKAVKDIDEKLISQTPDNSNKYIADDKIRNELQNIIKNSENTKLDIENYFKAKKIKSLRIHEKKPFKSLVNFKEKSKFKEIDNPKNYKYAESDGNYCAEIYIPNRGKNAGKWCVEIISNYNAHQKDFKPKWRIEEPEAKLQMRLFINDMVEIEKNNQKLIYRVGETGNSKKHGPYLRIRKHNIAIKEGNNWQVSAKQLQEINAKKVRISPLGKITYLKK